MAATNPFKTKGGLWINSNKTQTNKQPDFKGHIKVTKEQMQQMVQRGAAGLELQLELRAWKSLSQERKQYIALGADVYIPKNQDAPAPQATPEPAPTAAPPNPFGDFGDEGTF